MPEHDRERVRAIAGDHAQVSVAHAVGREPHPHLVGPGSSTSTSSPARGLLTSYMTAALALIASPPPRMRVDPGNAATIYRNGVKLQTAFVAREPMPGHVSCIHLE